MLAMLSPDGRTPAVSTSAGLVNAQMILASEVVTATETVREKMCVQLQSQAYPQSD